MPTIFIRMMLKVFGEKSPFFIFIYCNAFELLLFFFCLFLGSQTDYSLILYYKAKSQFISSCCSLYLWQIP